MNPFLRIAISFVLLFYGIVLQAQKEHEVQEGETLFSISQQYEVSVDTVRSFNDLEGEEIQPGQVLKIPVKVESGTSDTIEHRVSEGETLYSICKKYRADIDVVTQLNPDARESIEPGQVLLIPVGSDPSAEEEGRYPFDTTEAGYHYHEVEKKETLFSMSQRYGVPIDTIRSKNPHLEKVPEVGQLLRIPKIDGGGDEAESPLDLPGHLEREGYRIIRAQEGETLYSIARRNSMSLDELMEENPHLEGELKVGQALRIPRREDGRPPRSLKDTVIFHVVEAGESIRSIATLYGTDPILLVLANELFFKDIEAGDLLIVPIPSERRAPSPETEMKERYRVTLLLPLYLTENDSILRDPPSEEAPDLYGPSEYALDFYEGFRIAADSVAMRTGISFDLHTISTVKGQEGLEDLLQEKEIRKSDLVIGPFYKGNLKRTADVLKESGVHHVCPVAHSNKVLLGHPAISKAIPSGVTLVKGLAEHVAQEHSDKNVILVDSRKAKDDRREEVFQRSFDRELAKYKDRFRDSIPMVTIEEDSDELRKLDTLLREDSANIVCVPSGEKVFASRLMTHLSNLNDDVKDGNYPVQVFASEEWKNFETIDIKYKQRFDLNIITARHIQQDSLPTQRFYQDFRERTHTDPTDYGFLGHDIGTYYLRGLARFGTGFSNSFDRLKAPTLHMGFDFFRTGVKSGFENRHAYIINYTQDHRIERRPAR